MNLHELFRLVVRASVLAPVALTACGPDTAGAVAPVCENGLLSVAGLQPSVIPDVVRLRQVGTTDRRLAPTTLSSSGEACTSATNKPACQTALDSLAPTSGFAASCLQLCVDYHLATTLGDTVQALTSLDQLKTFLGTVDTAQEAMLIAFASGYSISCTDLGRGSAKATSTGWSVLATKGFACGPGTALTRHYLTVSNDGALAETRSEVIEQGQPNCAVGRRPPGLRSSGRSDCDQAVGRFFAEVAHLEAASVPAFERLFAELRQLGAPEALQRAALFAALDEIDHARRITEVAHRFGASTSAPRLEPRPLRTVLDLATDNAVEGCVRETFGALVAHVQAEQAGDAQLRSTMRTIADDETRHAEFSWALDAWLRSQLSPREQAAVEAARRAAVVRLRAELTAEVDPELSRVAGLPSAQMASALLDAIEPALLAA